jgi:folate-binding protein YgfZ
MTLLTSGMIEDPGSPGAPRTGVAAREPQDRPDPAQLSGQLGGQLGALLHAAALTPLDHLGWIGVTGADRVRWLNGMTTNSIQDLEPGEGNYNFLLNAQGRIQGDACAFALSQSLLLQTSRDRVPALIELLDRFIIMDDVELADLTATRSGLLCAGPQAAEALHAIGVETAGLPELGLRELPWHGFALTLIHAYSPLVPRFEIWAEPAAIEALTKALSAVPQVSGQVSGQVNGQVSGEALELLRLLEGTPRYGVDIRDRELPQETGQTRALHFAKGCYLGQEIVERIRSRGNVHRTFHAFALHGALPAPGTALEVEGKAVGELTSVARIPLASGTVQLALGYIRREALDRLSLDRAALADANASPALTYAGGRATPITTPVRDTRTIPSTGDAESH